MPVDLVFPATANERGAGYWLRVANLWAGRRRLRSDHSNEWRYEFLRTHLLPPPPPGVDPESRSRSFSWLMDGKPAAGGFSCVILGDTGEGDHSQYALLPIIRKLRPDFMIINGDVTYPAGESNHFRDGFFKPYANLDMPVWAVPGNHEYYSPNRGREFHEVFCTEIWRDKWEASGLKFRPMPGTYWELAEPDGNPALVIIGLDTGHSADLDGKRGGGILGLGRRQPADTAQHEWLDWRLRQAQQRGARVILLFHIPALVRGKNQKDVHLETLHRLIAKYSCVRLVITAHEHNYQHYEPAVFADFLLKAYRAPAVGPAPTYLVSGGGGAYINPTDFAEGGFPTATRFPDAKDWKKWAPAGLRLVAKLGLDKSVLNKIAIGLISLKPGSAEQSDADRPERLSLLSLKYDPQTGTTVTPCLVTDLAKMYALPDGSKVDVMRDEPGVDKGLLQACLPKDMTIQI